VIIDEVQYAPGLFRYLKAAVDSRRTSDGQFLLTGSQKFTLMKRVSESLAGRADVVELETLSFAEIRAALPETVLESVIVCCFQAIALKPRSNELYGDITPVDGPVRRLACFPDVS
jgi:predicted AAA+ superfamily ATPase